MTRRTSLLVALLTTALAACFGTGDDDVPGPEAGPITPQQIAQGCDANCDHQLMCGASEQTHEACVAECTADLTSPELGWIRGDAWLAISVCIGDLPCEADQSTCFSNCDPTSDHIRYEARCRELFTGCLLPEQVNGACETALSSESGATDDGWLCLVIPTIMNELENCVAAGASCESAETCIQSVLDTHNIDF